MTLRDSITKHVTRDLVSTVLTLLSSVSHNIKSDQLQELVDAQVNRLPALKYSVNSDIGLCVERLLSECHPLGNSPLNEVSNELYLTLKQNDEVVSELMSTLAADISQQLSAPLYDLRVSLPNEAVKLAESISNQVPPVAEFSHTKNMQHFVWGKLGTDTYRNAAVLFAQDRLNCFKRDSVQSFDSDKILRALPFGDITSVADEKTLKPKFVTVLTAALPEGDCHAMAADIILSSRSYRKWAMDAAIALQNKNIGESVVKITHQIDMIEDLLHLINASALTNLGIDISDTAMTVLKNIETVTANIQLIRAAMIWHKDVGLSEQLLLTPTVVQGNVFETFVSQGGTKEMIHDYVAYLQLNPHMTFGPAGVTSKTVINLAPRAQQTVHENAKILQEKALTNRSVALQNTLSVTLDSYRDKTMRDINNDLHHQQKNRALALLSQKSLEDIAVEYLVATRSNSIIKDLFKIVNAELVAAVKNSQSVTYDDVSRITCSAITTHVLKVLVKNFVVAKAAA